MGHPPIKPPSSRRDNPDSTTTPSPHPRTRPNHPRQRLTAKLGLTGGTDNHLVVMDVASSYGLTGDKPSPLSSTPG